jgi:hypothetical protein
MRRKIKSAKIETWYEAVLADNQHLTPSAILMAGYVVRAHISGRLPVSISAAAKYYDVTQPTMRRACWQLEERGHLYRLDQIFLCAPSPTLVRCSPRPGKFPTRETRQDK